ncbi:MAG: hypothetical protein ABFS02_00860 [Pseudomonadota bacterium]
MTFLANVVYVARSSTEVGLRVIAENLHTKEKRHTNSYCFTTVAMGED